MIPWGWVVLIAIVSGSVGMMFTALLAVGGAADDAREEAERAMAVNGELKTMQKRYWHLVDRYNRRDMERYKVDVRLHNLRAERRLLRGMALGEREDV